MANVVLVTERLLFTAAIIEYFTALKHMVLCGRCSLTKWTAFLIECSRKLTHNDGAGMHPRYDVMFELHNLVHETLNLHCEA